MTNAELARHIDNQGVYEVSKEELAHVALRFIELFRHGNHRSTDINIVARDVTPVPYVHP